MSKTIWWRVKLGTRVDILSRIASTLVGIVAVGMILMTFPEIRALGTTLLASAGVAGIVAGLAARPLFENLIAGSSSRSRSRSGSTTS